MMCGVAVVPLTLIYLLFPVFSVVAAANDESDEVEFAGGNWTERADGNISDENRLSNASGDGNNTVDASDAIESNLSSRITDDSNATLGNGTNASNWTQNHSLDQNAELVEHPYELVDVDCEPASVVSGYCVNLIDETLRTSRQCEALLKSGYTCAKDFCSTCEGRFAGMCDLACGFGNCSVCGDCWLSEGGSEGACDDGNNFDGDGCSSNCLVEDKWTCRRRPSRADILIAVDKCERCVDAPDWADNQGFTCEVYSTAGVCNTGSRPSDLVVRKRTIHTPKYHHYSFVEEFQIGSDQPLVVVISVQAAHDAHVFLGIPAKHGYEIILKEKRTENAAIYMHPGRVLVARQGGLVWNSQSEQQFWISLDGYGNFSMGFGDVPWRNEMIVFDGNDAENSTFVGPDADFRLDQLHVATGWGADGYWDVHFLSGSEAPTFEELKSGSLTACDACCVCGGGYQGTLYEHVQQGRLSRFSPLPVRINGRRLQTEQRTSLAEHPALLGRPTPDGFTLHFGVAGCEMTTPCTVNAVVVPAVARSVLQGLYATAAVLSSLWVQLHHPGCRLRNHQATSNASRWRAINCGMVAGASYVVAVQLMGQPALSLIDFTVPLPPLLEPKGLTVQDTSPIPMHVGGGISVVGSLEEENTVWQYRLFWHPSTADQDVHGARLLAGVVNTYARGGLRSVINNECVFNDCGWTMVLLSGLVSIQHRATKECLCRQATTVVPKECPEILGGPNSNRQPDLDHCSWGIEKRHADNSLRRQLRDIRSPRCLCQIDVPPIITSDGFQAPPPVGDARRQLVMLDWCDALDRSQDAEHGLQMGLGICDWSFLPIDPRLDAVFEFDARENADSLSDSGIPALRIGEGAAELYVGPPGAQPLTMTVQHTIAFWIRVRSLDFPSNASADSLRLLSSSSGSACIELSPNLVSEFDVNAAGFPGELQDSKTSISAAQGWTLLAAVGDSPQLNGTAAVGGTLIFTSGPIEDETSLWKGSFACSSTVSAGGAAWVIGGCVAKVSFQNIQPQMWRTCSLDVNIDFDPLLEQQISSVVVRSGDAIMNLDVAPGCQGGLDGESGFTFPSKCIEAQVIDDILRSSERVREVLVEINVAAPVDPEMALRVYNHQGAYISGSVEVTCTRHAAETWPAANEQTVTQTGLTHGSCTGTIVDHLASNSQGLQAYLGQSWMWDRALSSDEIQALFRATRPRYFPELNAELVPQMVPKTGPEVFVSARLRCSSPGCVAADRLSGIGQNHVSCLMTVKVAITDFSMPSETVEYVRVGSSDVITNCWPQAEGKAWESFLCADNFPISPALLSRENVQISAKISDGVDSYHSHGGDLLDATVEIRCLGAPVDARRLSMSAGLPPQSLSIGAVASNDQGESPALRATVVDSVNDFDVVPKVRPTAMDALAVDFTAFDEDGLVWLNVLQGSSCASLKKEDVLRESFGQREACPHSHRRRGPSSIATWRTNPIVSSCVMAPMAQYELVAYVDRKEAPYIGGTLACVEFEGFSMPTPALRSWLRAGELAFEDSNVHIGMIGGTLTFAAAKPEYGIIEYVVHWGKNVETVGTAIGAIPASGAASYSFEIADGPIPFAANDLVVYARDIHGLALRSRSITLRDLTAGINTVPEVRCSPTAAGAYMLEVSLQLVFEDSVVDIAVVPAGAEQAIATPVGNETLDADILGVPTVCSQTGLTSPTATAVFQVGPCQLSSLHDYAVVLRVRMEQECKCSQPCECIGTVASSVQIHGEWCVSGGNGRLRIPHVDGPVLQVKCEDCAEEQVVRSTGTVLDESGQYPVKIICAACRPGDGGANVSACVLPGKSQEKHRFWRLLFDVSSTCNVTEVVEVNFFGFSADNADGILLEGDTTASDGLNDTASIVSDGIIDPLSEGIDLQSVAYVHPWIQLDLGASSAESVLRVGIHFSDEAADCLDLGATLQHSDDASTWTTRHLSKSVGDSFPVLDLFVRGRTLPWQLEGTRFQLASFSEGTHRLVVDGLTPGSLYDLICFSENAAGKATLSDPVRIQTQCPSGHIAFATTGGGGCLACVAGTFAPTLTSTSCTPCDEGYFAPDNASVICHVCLPGFYSDFGSAECTSCDPGHIAPAGSGICIPCPAGKVPNNENADCTACPIGFAVSGVGNRYCSECPAGKYVDPSTSNCTICEAGRYSPNASSSCFGCEVGRYSLEGSSTCLSCPGGFESLQNASNCDACPPGRAAAPGDDQCEMCSPGRFASLAGSGSCEACSTGESSDYESVTCTPCSPGRYATDIAAAECFTCGQGTYTPGGNMPCIPCPVGSAATNGSGICQICSAGTVPDGNSEVCDECAEGRFAAVASAPSCTDCPPGTWSARGRSTCASCDQGRFSEYASASCSPCHAGFFSPVASSFCNVCPPGRSSPVGSAVCSICTPGRFATNASSACSPCSPGRFADAAESSECELCLPGHFAQHGKSFCGLCAQGRFAAEGSGQCSYCPAGKYAEPVSENCTVCPTGRFAGRGRGFCEICPAGKYSQENSGTCSNCPAGSIAPVAGMGECDLCNGGTFSETGKTVCKICAAGFQSDQGSGFCEICPRGRYSFKQSGICSPCAAGRSSNGGTDTCELCSAGRWAQGGGYWCAWCTAGRSSAIGLGGVGSLPQPTNKECNEGFTLDGLSTGKVYDGHGAITGGPAARSLFDYKEPHRGHILDYLFLPRFGASIQMLKIEFGAESQSRSDIRCDEDYDFWLIGEARKRNPTLRLYGCLMSGTFGSTTIDYVTSWLGCAERAAGGTVEIFSIRNYSVWGPTAKMIQLRKGLDDAGFYFTRLVVPEGKYDETILKQAADTPEFASALHGGVIGVREPCFFPRPQIFAANLTYWDTEDQGVAGDWNGAGCWGRTMNQNFVWNGITSSLARSLLWSSPSQLSPISDGFIDTISPWSGVYTLRAPFWVTAHTTQFVEIGWIMLDSVGGSSGILRKGGSYLTFMSPERDQFVLVIEKLHGNCRNCQVQTTLPETLRFTLANGLAEILEEIGNNDTNENENNQTGGFKLCFWVSNRTHHFHRLPDLLLPPPTIDNETSFTLTALPDTIYTLASKDGGQSRGAHYIPQPNASFSPDVFEYSFDDYDFDVSAEYFVDFAGSWQVTQDPSPAADENKVLKQCLTKQGGLDPLSIIGDTFVNAKMSVDVFLPPSPFSGTAVPAALGGDSELDYVGIQSFLAGLCLTVQGIQGSVGTFVGLESCLYNEYGRVAFDTETGLIRGRDALCVASRGACPDLPAEDAVCQVPCGEVPYQTLDEPIWTWRADETLRLEKHSDTCLTVVPLGPESFAVRARACETKNPGFGQRWSLRRAPPVLYGGFCFRLSARPSSQDRGKGESKTRVLDGYCLTVGSDFRNRGLWQFSLGERILATGDISSPRGTWHQLRLESRDSILYLGVDEQEVEVVTTGKTAGVAALISGWHQAYFDNFVLERL